MTPGGVNISRLVDIRDLAELRRTFWYPRQGCRSSHGYWDEAKESRHHLNDSNHRLRACLMPSSFSGVMRASSKGNDDPTL